MTKFSAKFSNGFQMNQNSKREFSHAWAVFFNNDQVSGFASSHELAVKAAASWVARFNREDASVPTRTEIVEATH